MSTGDASNSSEEYINTSLLQDDDILEALPPESRDTVGMRDFHRYWDGKGEQKLRELHKMCGTVSVLWEVPARAEGDDKIYATVAQFWRYAEIVGLTHVGGLAELTKFMRPETEGSVNVPPPAQQRLTVADFAFGILQIASKLTTVKMCARYYGIGDDKDFITDRLEALLKGIPTRPAGCSIVESPSPMTARRASSAAHWPRVSAAYLRCSATRMARWRSPPPRSSCSRPTLSRAKAREAAAAVRSATSARSLWR